jgi:hypothetical protein
VQASCAPATCKGLLNHHKLANNVFYALSCSEIFQDFRTFLSSKWNVQQEQIRICCRCEQEDFFSWNLWTISCHWHHIQHPTYILNQKYHRSKPKNNRGQIMECLWSVLGWKYTSPQSRTSYSEWGRLVSRFFCRICMGMQNPWARGVISGSRFG